MSRGASVKYRRPRVPLSALKCRYRFPDPEVGTGPEGVIAVGADLDPATVLHAYHLGIFPWPAPHVEKDLILWCSPEPRGTFTMGPEPHWSRSLLRSRAKKPFEITLDEDFHQVMELCGDRRGGTWITEPLTACYHELFDMGWAHSLEVWNTSTGDLVGGIYGLSLGGCFTAESMFHRETDASKVAFSTLIDRLRGAGYTMFDTETMSSHLQSMGCVPMRRRDFVRDLRVAVTRELEFPC
jgi:leucyl/phenylalanyl-tRNA--protein transferase